MLRLFYFSGCDLIRTERDVSGWSSERLSQLLLAVRVEGPEGICQLTDISKLDGEASINNRKGKLIFFYEWQLRASWLGTSSGGLKYRGTIEVLNLSDENDMDDLDISVSLCKDQPDTPLLNLMKKTGVNEVRRVLGEYIRQLRSDGPKRPQETKKNQNQTSKTQVDEHLQMFKPLILDQEVTSDLCMLQQISPAPRCPNLDLTFDLKETFQTSVDELYRTFVNQEVFTRSAAVVDARRGGRFQLLDGNVSGEFTQLVRLQQLSQSLVPDRRIEMRWRFRTWPSEHYATISLDLEDQGDETELRMECRGVPAGEEDSTREGFNRFYFQAIKQTFGY
ncbi:Activator of 90 kDa heat shock protein ATPase -like protein 1 [Collichthys lucidus]|uniref:Activator of 90 kDa heat shock protein ATPase-like protein 1 n=1 Tax=Collichthys lucidus TaxID=240159 RepID=A0A4U5TUX3_COLLU|nr:Activator of 90 kDa heat shock protein ATPase -like protein 1 [Collichthys lucidus]